MRLCLKLNTLRDVMDADTLLSPISAHSPCGEDMSFSPAFDQIAELRRADDPSLNQGAWVTSLKQADWPATARQCAELLRARSKDLRLAMWLTEARAMSEGHQGLAEGLNFCTDLCAQYWPDVHPQPDGGDMEERIGNIAWLLQRITDLAQTMPVTHSRKGERHSLRDLAHARTREARSGDSTMPHEAIHGEAQGAPLTVARFRQALADTPAAHLRQTLAAQQEAEAALHRWQAVVDTQLGQNSMNGPSFVAAREALAQATHDIGRLLRDVGVAPLGGNLPVADALHGQTADAATPAPTEASHAIGTHHMAPPPPSAPATMQTNVTSILRGPTTRHEALHLLREVADFFRQTEPHSPVAYLADKAVKWGDMPLHQWLQEVVKDNSAMAHLNELLGVPGQSSQEGQA